MNKVTTALAGIALAAGITATLTAPAHALWSDTRCEFVDVIRNYGVGAHPEWPYLCHYKCENGQALYKTTPLANLCPRGSTIREITQGY